MNHVIKYYYNIYTWVTILHLRTDIAGGTQGDNMKENEPEDEWEKKKKGSDKESSSKSIRESAFGGTDSSEYIQGAVMEASKSETAAAESAGEGDFNRFQTWVADKLTKGKAPEAMYYMNPFNYDRIDWIFALGFVGVIASAFTMFLTESVIMTVASLVGMFVSFCVMLVCMGIEDLLKDGFHRLGIGDTEEETEEFQGGESFQDEQQGQT